MFEQPNIACHQSRGSETKDLPERKIPGHYSEHWSDGLELDVAYGGVCLHKLIGQMLLRCTGVIATNPGALFRFAYRAFDWLPHFQRHDARKIMFLSFEYFRGARHHRCSFSEWSLAVHSERSAGALQFFVDLSFRQRL